FRERMRREARAAARLGHPHVDTVYDFGEQDDVPYMVMELIDGPSLSELLYDGPLPWRRALRYCAEVAAALAAVHDAGLVHRDVKPGNVMIGPAGAKLVDFGISAEIGGLVRRGLAKDPEARPSARELARAWRRAAENTSRLRVVLPALPASARRSRRSGLATAGALAVAGAATVALLSGGADNS